MQLPISGLFISLFALLFLFLSYRVVGQRRAKQIGIGDRGDKQMLRSIRVQANFIEYVPMALLLLIVAEINGASAWYLYAVASVLFIARCAHAYGLNQYAGSSQGRFFGTLFTWLSILALALKNMYLLLFA